MNSDITTYSVSRPVTWEAFRRWPKDIQAAYLKGIYENYYVTNSMVAGMFDKSRQTFIQYLNYHCLPKSPFRGASKADRERWERFCNVGYDGHPDPVGEPGEPGVTGAPEVIEVHKISPVDPKTGTVAFDGNVEDVLIAIRRMFAGNPNLHMKVTWEENDE